MTDRLADVLAAALVVGRARQSKVGCTWAQLDALAAAVKRLDDASGPSVPLEVACPECGADYEAARAKNERSGRVVHVSPCPNSRFGHSLAWERGEYCCWCGKKPSGLQRGESLDEPKIS